MIDEDAELKSFLKENYYMNNRIEPYKGILYGSFIKVKNNFLDIIKCNSLIKYFFNDKKLKFF